MANTIDTPANNSMILSILEKEIFDFRAKTQDPNNTLSHEYIKGVNDALDDIKSSIDFFKYIEASRLHELLGMK